MKKLIKYINSFTVEFVLFFVYFLVLGLAKIIYNFQKESSNLTSWTIVKINQPNIYFNSPY